MTASIKKEAGSKQNRQRPRAVIVYLSRSIEKDVKNLKKSLCRLDKNFNATYKYPVIIFHDDFSEQIKKDLRKLTVSPISFEQIKSSLPNFLNLKQVEERYKINRGDQLYHPIGYRHMCRFWANIAYWHPSLKNYDWYWRLDTDSFIMFKIKYDVFDVMEKNNYSYGYCIMNKENPVWAKGLWEATADYVRQKKIRPEFLDEFAPGAKNYMNIYYNNFEIAKLDLWKSKECHEYFKYLDRLGGIYEKRWGDALIHTFSVAMFVPKNKVHHFKDINYVHAWCANATNPLIYAYFYLLRKLDEFEGKIGIFLRKIDPRLYNFAKKIIKGA